MLLSINVAVSHDDRIRKVRKSNIPGAYKVNVGSASE